MEISCSSSPRARLLVTAFMVVVVMGSSSLRSFGCMEEEKNGLLLLKAAFNCSSNIISDQYCLSSWNYTDNDNCYCSWEGVVCSSRNLNNIARRVTQLWLNMTRWSFSDDLSGHNYWYLNASIFLVFEELQVLDLSANHLTELIGTLRLKKLQSLHLGDNPLNHVPDFAELPSLQAVDLSWINPLKSLLPLQGLKLDLLDLESTGLSSAEYNLSIIWEMTSLKALALGSNSLNPRPEGLCGLVNLEELDVRQNAFHGPLPPCLMNMTSLRGLELKYNYFQGTIPDSFFSSLGSLEFISLSGNYFQGSLSLASFGNNSKLEVFQLTDNSHQLSIETENPLYLPSLSQSQMKSFRISNCLLNKPNGAIPSFLHRLRELIELEISHCGVQDNFPNWLLENNTHLWYLDLTSNSISGNLDFNYSSSKHDLWVFDVSSNRLQGTLPSNISSIFPNLGSLNMSNNILQGSIPSLGETVYLDFLDLSSNNFTGELPGTLVTDPSTIDLLKLSDNYLSGKLPRLSGSINFLYLDNNGFTGDVSSLLRNNSNLDTLDVSNNLLTGIISDPLIGDRVQSLQLQYLVLLNNNLKSNLPSSFCKLKNLTFIDLSGNDIGPDMPPCTNLSSVKYLHLQSTNLRGLFPNFLRGASSLVTLDLRGNALSGPIPSWIGTTFLNLRVLVLQGNDFSGTIPWKICQLNKLSILDLSANHFLGGIPSCLNNLTFGKREDTLDSLDTSSGTGTDDNGYHYGNLSIETNGVGNFISAKNFETVNFLSKNRLETYEATVLEYMSGLDLSSNNLSGTIPTEIGWLTQLHALNLSNNHLTGSIPTSFSNLEQIESLDLSHNNLNGELPPQLTELFHLSVFSVARNNLSGRTPEWKNQFSTFDRTCYEGNPFLCGPPLESYSSSEDPSPPKSSKQSETEEDPFKDVFRWSFAGSFPVAFIVTIVVLYFSAYYHTPGFLFHRRQ